MLKKYNCIISWAQADTAGDAAKHDELTGLQQNLNLAPQRQGYSLLFGPGLLGLLDGTSLRLRSHDCCIYGRFASAEFGSADLQISTSASCQTDHKLLLRLWRGDCGRYITIHCMHYFVSATVVRSWNTQASQLLDHRVELLTRRCRTKR